MKAEAALLLVLAVIGALAVGVVLFLSERNERQAERDRKDAAHREKVEAERTPWTVNTYPVEAARHTPRGAWRVMLERPGHVALEYSVIDRAQPDADASLSVREAEAQAFADERNERDGLNAKPPA